MRFFRKVTAFFGIGSSHTDPPHPTTDSDHTTPNNNHQNADDVRHDRSNVDPIPAGPRKGFSVPVHVPVDRPSVGPILVPCHGDGGVQGLRWYAARLKIDQDGDVADEFLDEVSPNASSATDDQARPILRFQPKHNTPPAKIQHQALSQDGTLQHRVDCRGQLRWL
ncbi:hypothetical protein vseg_016675 [Gypsophila vaccaria]